MLNIILVFVIYIFSIGIVIASELSPQDNKSNNPASAADRKILNRVIKQTIIAKDNNNHSKDKINLSHGYISNQAQVVDSHYKENNLEITIGESKKNSDDNKILFDASAAYELGQIEVAAQLYKSVLAKSPDNYNALFGIASIYQLEKQTDDARSIYTKILKLYPEDEAALNNFIRLSGDDAPNETIVELIKLENLKPEVSLIPAQIAIIYNNIKNYDQAIKYFRKALFLSPENMYYRYNLAVAYDLNGSYPEAIYLYRQILKESYTNQDYSFDYDQIGKRINYLSNIPS